MVKGLWGMKRNRVLLVIGFLCVSRALVSAAPVESAVGVSGQTVKVTVSGASGPVKIVVTTPASSRPSVGTTPLSSPASEVVPSSAPVLPPTQAPVTTPVENLVVTPAPSGSGQPLPKALPATGDRQPPAPASPAPQGGPLVQESKPLPQVGAAPDPSHDPLQVSRPPFPKPKPPSFAASGRKEKPSLAVSQNPTPEEVIALLQQTQREGKISQGITSAQIEQLQVGGLEEKTRFHKIKEFFLNLFSRRKPLDTKKELPTDKAKNADSSAVGATKDTKGGAPVKAEPLPVQSDSAKEQTWGEHFSENAVIYAVVTAAVVYGTYRFVLYLQEQEKIDKQNKRRLAAKIREDRARKVQEVEVEVFE